MPRAPDAQRAALVRAERALSDFLAGPVDAAVIAETLTAFIAEMLDLAAFMESGHELILGRAYLISTQGPMLPDWPEDERPLADLAAAPQKGVARALTAFIEGGGTSGVPLRFTAAMARLLACLVDFADHHDANFEACWVSAWDARTT
jgi:hypothetical protein